MGSVKWQTSPSAGLLVLSTAVSAIEDLGAEGGGWPIIYFSNLSIVAGEIAIVKIEPGGNAGSAGTAVGGAAAAYHVDQIVIPITTELRVALHDMRFFSAIAAAGTPTLTWRTAVD